MFASLVLAAMVAAQPPDENPVPVVKLTLSPAAAPTPALKYELLPRAFDRTPGNAAEGYYRAGLLLAESKAQVKTNPEQVRAWLKAPVAEFPVPEVKGLLKARESVLREVEKAVLMDHCHWNLNARVRTDGMNAMLPEIQPARDAASLLLLRARIEAREGREADAIRTIRTALQVGKHVGDGTSLINNLVGTAVGSEAADRIEELLQRPACPNLYWALSGLTRPFTDPSAAFEGDMLMLPGTFSIFREFRGEPVSEGEAGRIVDRFMKQLRQTDGGKADPWEGFVTNVGLAFLLARQKDAAREQLIAGGRKAEELEDMAAAQLVFLASWDRHRAVLDEEAKWFRQPYHVAIAGLSGSRRRFQAAKDAVLKNKDPFGIAFVLMTPAFDKVFTAHVKLERRLALLRVIEAVRMHAAENGGKLPDHLADIKTVAVPDDPAAGKPFAYKRTGDTATLEGPPPENEAPTSTNCLRYELSLRK